MTWDIGWSSPSPLSPMGSNLNALQTLTIITTSKVNITYIVDRITLIFSTTDAIEAVAVLVRPVGTNSVFL